MLWFHPGKLLSTSLLLLMPVHCLVVAAFLVSISIIPMNEREKDARGSQKSFSPHRRLGNSGALEKGGSL